MYNISELSPLNSQQKSFYGKAEIWNEDGKTLNLYSYKTLVCSVDLTKKQSDIQRIRKIFSDNR